MINTILNSIIWIHIWNRRSNVLFTEKKNQWIHILLYWVTIWFDLILCLFWWWSGGILWCTILVLWFARGGFRLWQDLIVSYFLQTCLYECVLIHKFFRFKEIDQIVLMKHPKKRERRWVLFTFISCNQDKALICVFIDFFFNVKRIFDLLFQIFILIINCNMVLIMVLIKTPKLFLVNHI